MNRIILALDTTNLKEALSITQKIKPKIFTVKLGLEFLNAHGKEGVKKFNEIGIGNLMLDLKLHDIPETVYKSIKALDNIDFGFLTIHGQGGKSMIKKAKKAAEEIKSKPKIMMVTILTALNDDDLKSIGNNNTVVSQVVAQAKVDAERLKVQAEAVLTATIKRREEQAVERIAQAEATAIKDVRDQAIELAIGVATKIITEKMTKTVQNELVKDASEDLMKKFQH